MKSIIIEKLISDNKTICNMETRDGATYSSRTVSDNEAWKMEVVCLKAGWNSSIICNQIVNDKIHTIVKWEA